MYDKGRTSAALRAAISHATMLSVCVTVSMHDACWIQPPHAYDLWHLSRSPTHVSTQPVMRLAPCFLLTAWWTSSSPNDHSRRHLRGELRPRLLTSESRTWDPGEFAAQLLLLMCYHLSHEHSFSTFWFQTTLYSGLPWPEAHSLGVATCCASLRPLRHCSQYALWHKVSSGPENKALMCVGSQSWITPAIRPACLWERLLCQTLCQYPDHDVSLSRSNGSSAVSCCTLVLNLPLPPLQVGKHSLMSRACSHGPCPRVSPVSRLCVWAVAADQGPTCPAWVKGSRAVLAVAVVSAATLCPCLAAIRTWPCSTEFTCSDAATPVVLV
jgi:hypothetical protein